MPGTCSIFKIYLNVILNNVILNSIQDLTGSRTSIVFGYSYCFGQRLQLARDAASGCGMTFRRDKRIASWKHNQQRHPVEGCFERPNSAINTKPSTTN
jgi:hypothetical protein